MALNKYHYIHTQDDDVNRIQGVISPILNQLSEIQLLGGVFITDASVTSGVGNRLEHGLGRAVVGYIVVRNNASVTIYDDQDNETEPTVYLKIGSSGTATITLWVF